MNRNNSALYIKKESIENYFQNHQEDLKIQDRKALFIRFLKERDFTGDFEDYLKHLSESKIDMKGIYHVMIPAEAFYSKTFYFRHSSMNVKANQIARKWGIIDYDIEGKVLKDVIEDYTLAGKLTIPHGSYYGFSEFQMKKEESARILAQYEPIYGKETIEEVKQYVKSKI